MLKDALEKCLVHGSNGRAPDFQRFVFTFELVPARASKGKAIDQTIRFAQEAAEHKRICALSITDNAGGHPALTPQALGSEIKSLGMAPIIHFSCKDKNRNLIESQLFELDRAGLNTLLVLTGDNPRYGYKGRAKPVFDLDSVLVLAMIEEMRKGLLLHQKAPGGGIRLPVMDFYSGCVVSPFKKTFPEQVLQYVKLKKKIACGARFIISQMGYDVRKFHELRLLLDKLSINVPLLATVLIPTVRLAKIIHKNIIPGCTMPLRLLEKMEKWPEKKALELRIDTAARLISVIYGLGYEGVHLSGPGLEYKHVREVIQRAEFYASNWQDHVKDFLFQEEWHSFIFERDKETGLNKGTFVKAPKGLAVSLRPGFLLGKCIHRLFFEPDKGLFQRAKKLILRCGQNSRCVRLLTSIEYFFKEMLYDCYRCGDCYLGEMEFICPQSQCAKRLLNGPCGGSHDGWCEVWPKEKRCMFVRQFKRAGWDSSLILKDQPVIPPRDWALDRKSSWLNFYLGKDHNNVTGRIEHED